MNINIAIVGMACCYPDAANPDELWANALAGRRSFRRIPPERLSAEDYYSPDPDAVDRTYATEAAVIDGYEFDRVAFRVVGSTYRAADLAHVKDGRIVRIAGSVIVRQRPGTAKGFVFLSMEDETGVMNAIVNPATFDRFSKCSR